MYDETLRRASTATFAQPLSATVYAQSSRLRMISPRLLLFPFAAPADANEDDASQIRETVRLIPCPLLAPLRRCLASSCRHPEPPHLWYVFRAAGAGWCKKRAGWTLHHQRMRVCKSLASGGRLRPATAITAATAPSKQSGSELGTGSRANRDGDDGSLSAALAPPINPLQVRQMRGRRRTFLPGPPRRRSWCPSRTPSRGQWR